MPDVIPHLISIHKDHTAVVNGLWGIYQGVSLALLGYVFSQEFVRKNAWVLAAMSSAFIFFSIANQRAILRSQELIHAVAVELNAIAALSTTDKSMGMVLRAYEVIPASKVQLGHIAFTVLVILAVWAIYAIQRTRPAPAKSAAEKLTDLRVQIAEHRLSKMQAGNTGSVQ